MDNNVAEGDQDREFIIPLTPAPYVLYKIKLILLTFIDRIYISK